MGFLDKALKTGKDLLGKNAGKVDQVIEKAGDLVDKKTQGKYAGTVNKVQDQAKKAAAKAAAESGHTPPPHQPPPNPSIPPVPPTPPSPAKPPTQSPPTQS
ncbi:hypothetical protein BH11ACT6_BH11ACT6_50980 [soil metagenome]